MHLVLTTKGPEDSVGTEVFRGSTGKEKQKGRGNGGEGEIKNRERLIITNEMKFLSLPATFTLHTIRPNKPREATKRRA
jgi:hypothetical protein